MKERLFFIISLTLAILALSTHLWALSLRAKSLGARTLAIGGLPVEKAQALAESKTYSQQVPILHCGGLVFAAGSAVCVVLSSRRREPAWRSIPIGLLGAYVLLQFVMV